MNLQSTARRRLSGLFCAALWLVLVPELPAADVPHPYEAASTGYFRDQDTLPGAYSIYRAEQASRLWGLGPGGGDIRRGSFSSDAHAGVAGYAGQSCVSCHEQQRYSLHGTRGNVSCVQCHRGEPISGIHHYYSPMNPIRRHAYVCAKCHQGASASFATYVVHEPAPLAAATREAFPLIHYAVWFMVILAGGVFALFLPLVTLWGVRELLGLGQGRARGAGGGSQDG
ncbi:MULTISPECIES: cytochrome c3 family protein [Thiorhodovibrio]|uniref:hypothetical protein n=1 Tax=Thiorhodovibrio TaxID=61593 RepID=UPI001912A44B|nr:MULTISPECIES: hypothetical protein [Thiorhodovibrio]MBK5969842.1 hypothetical protein [Thiorhodovibrio winogradskyi]WPL12114.1 hypothetical protein Thiosp_01870 [Thiorhodovibrio litoralis]